MLDINIAQTTVPTPASSLLTSSAKLIR